MRLILLRKGKRHRKTRQVNELFLEHYPLMTEKKIRKLFAMLQKNFRLTAVSLLGLENYFLEN